MPASRNTLSMVAFPLSLWPFAHKLFFSLLLMPSRFFYCQLCGDALPLLSRGGQNVLAVKGELWGRAVGRQAEAPGGGWGPAGGKDGAADSAPKGRVHRTGGRDAV